MLYLVIIGISVVLIIGGIAMVRSGGWKKHQQTSPDPHPPLEWILYAGTCLALFGAFALYVRRSATVSTTEYLVYGAMIAAGITSAVARRLIFGRWK
jgi:hypothetical protein